jgi:hypothetical protein
MRMKIAAVKKFNRKKRKKKSKKKKADHTRLQQIGGVK